MLPGRHYPGKKLLIWRPFKEELELGIKQNSSYLAFKEIVTNPIARHEMSEQKTEMPVWLSFGQCFSFANF